MPIPVQVRTCADSTDWLLHSSMAQFVFDDPIRAMTYVTLVDPNEGQGRELLGVQKAAQDDQSAALLIEGKEIVVLLQ